MSKSTGCLAAIALLLFHWLVGSSVLMLLVGVAHSEWWSDLPTMSFRAALIIYGVLAIFHAFISGVSEKNA